MAAVPWTRPGTLSAMQAYRTVAAKPTTYRGVRMRSRTEAKAARLLDDWGIPWQYEPVTFRSGRAGYIPDFLLWPGKHEWWLEIKHPAIYDVKAALTSVDGDGTLKIRPGHLHVALKKMLIIRKVRSNRRADLALWICDPDSDKRGTLLLSYGGSSDWQLRRHAGAWFASAGHVQRRLDEINKPWWRKIFRR